MSSLAAINPGFGDYGKGKAEAEEYLVTESKFKSAAIFRAGYILGENNPHPRIQYYKHQLETAGVIKLLNRGEFSTIVHDYLDIAHSIVELFEYQLDDFQLNFPGIRTTPAEIIEIISQLTNTMTIIEEGENGDPLGIPIAIGEADTNKIRLTEIIQKYL